MTKKDLVVRFDGEKTEVKSVVGCSSSDGAAEGGGRMAEGGSGGGAPSATASAPAQPLSPNDNPAYGSPLALRAAELAGRGGSDDRGEIVGWIG